MEIKVAALADNTAGYGYLGEWGISLLVEVDGLKILVDTGTTFTAVHNARVMGVDLTSIDKVVLSHGHNDHTGGLRQLLQAKGGELEVVAHPDIWDPKYVRLKKEEEPRYIGIPHSRLELEGRGARFHLSRVSVNVGHRIMTSGEIHMEVDYEEVDSVALLKANGGFVPDPLADDLALIIDADFGLVVVLGCAHRGLVNTLRQAQRLTGKERIYAAIGGAHLFRGPAERIERTIADLKGMGIARLVMAHCTGFSASARLAQEFGEACSLYNAGSRFTLP